MERVLRFRDNQHEEDRVTRLHSGNGNQTDSGIEQNEYDDDDDDNDDQDEKTTKKTSARKAEKRRRRRQAKKKGKTNVETTSNEKIDDESNDQSQVEIEYVQEDIPVKRGDGLYSHFVKVFENFKLDPTVDENGEYHTFAYAGGLFKTPVDFNLMETRKLSYEFKLDNGEEKTYHYWQAIFAE